MSLEPVWIESLPLDLTKVALEYRDGTQSKKLGDSFCFLVRCGVCFWPLRKIVHKDYNVTITLSSKR